MYVPTTVVWSLVWSLVWLVKQGYHYYLLYPYLPVIAPTGFNYWLHLLPLQRHIPSALGRWCGLTSTSTTTTTTNYYCHSATHLAHG
jgi:hypothetical protein